MVTRSTDSGYRIAVSRTALCFVASFAILSNQPSFGQQAQPADRFVDSIGVNTHLFKGVGDSTDTYANYSTMIWPALLGLGVRHIRDEMAVDNPGGNYYSRLNDLASNGIHCDLISECQWNTAAQAQAITATYLLGAQECVEGTNELDNYPGYSSTWMSVDHQYTQDIKTAYGGNAQTQNIAIIGFSDNDDPALGHSAAYANAYGNYSPYVNYGNCHPYTFPWGQPEGNMQTLVNGNSVLWGSAPFILTETGCYTGTAPLSLGWYPHGKYTLRSLLTAFNLGAYRTYLYELADEHNNPSYSEDNFGLITYNGSAKPAYYAVKNTISLLSDPGPAFTPGTLAWSLSGSTANVNSTLLQKRNGDYYLVLWIGCVSNDSTVSQAVTLNVPSQVGQATLYTLDNAGNMSSSPMNLVNGQIGLNVKDTVSVVKLTPCQHLQSRWQGTYINTENGLTCSTISQGWWSAQWLRERVDDTYFRLKNRHIGQYLNVQSGSLGCTAIDPSWQSAQWSLEYVDGVNWRIKSRSQGTYINIENGLGCSAIDPGWWSAQWQLPPSSS